MTFDNTVALIVLGTLCVYFLPIIVAGRQHPNAAGIFVLNLFAGWTFIGWIVALVWACSGERNSDGPVYIERREQADAPNYLEQ